MHCMRCSSCFCLPEIILCCIIQFNMIRLAFLCFVNALPIIQQPTLPAQPFNPFLTQQKYIFNPQQTILSPLLQQQTLLPAFRPQFIPTTNNRIQMTPNVSPQRDLKSFNLTQQRQSGLPLEDPSFYQPLNNNARQATPFTNFQTQKPFLYPTQPLLLPQQSNYEPQPPNNFQNQNPSLENPSLVTNQIQPPISTLPTLEQQNIQHQPENVIPDTSSTSGILPINSTPNGLRPPV